MSFAREVKRAVKVVLWREGRGMEPSISAEVRKAMTAALTAGGFTSVEAAAWEVSLTVALSKVSGCERECAHFRHKYGSSLDGLRSRVEQEHTSEDFVVEDDLAAWEFAERALQLWHKRVEILRHAAA